MKYLWAWGFLIISTTVYAHDSWINHQQMRNGAGEWCCGEGDCFAVPADQVQTGDSGYVIKGISVVGAKDKNYSEIVPYKETLPSGDKSYWRCQKPDGTRRCFFAPPSSF